MLDMPVEFKQPKVEIVQLVASLDGSENQRALFSSHAKTPKDSPSQIGDAIISKLENGFSLKVLFHVLTMAYQSVKANKDLSEAEQKEQIIAVLDYIIDKTDTPYLPDYYADPLFKAMIRPSVDVLFNAKKGSARFSPSMREGPITSFDLQNFVTTMKETYQDGFQWSDIAVYLDGTIEFVMGYKNLTLQERLEAATMGVNMIIDMISVGPFSSTITQPLLKTFSRPLVMFIFSNIS